MAATTGTRHLDAVAGRPGEASIEDLARLRRADRGVPDGSPETTTLERAGDHVLDLVRGCREQGLPEAVRMAAEHPDERAYADKVTRLHELIRQNSRRALVLGASLARVTDASRLDKAEAYALRQELVSRGLLAPCDIHLA